MSITLYLSPEAKQKLMAAAQLRGISPEEHARQILDQNLTLTPQERAEGLRALFASYTEEDDDGDVTWEEIFRRMDEWRGDGRKLFPPELKGVSW